MPHETAPEAAMSDAALRRRRFAGASTQLGTEVSINFGSSLAGLVIPVVGSFVVVAVRQLVMAIAVLPFYRPKRAGLTWRRLRPAVALGVVLAVMNVTFYESVDRLGLGVAATIEFLGPLAIALVTSRRLLDLACALAAGAGVLLLIGPWAGGSGEA
ncbi:EamA family transporter, partial [Agromyces sp. CCNWLW208]